MKKFMAFTLAETLIVMGVIGIVSALTLPNLNSSTGEKEKVAKVKKIYQNLNDALGRAEAVYGPFAEWNKSTDGDDVKAKRIGERITEFMKVSKTCGIETGGTCLTNTKVKFIDGSDGSNINSTANLYKIITADGTSIVFSKSGNITVDIDGPSKGKFKAGNDYFAFTIDSEKGLIPDGEDDTFAQLLTNVTGPGSHCATWIIRYDNADYLKISSVSGSTATCTGGTANALTETNPTCK